MPPISVMLKPASGSCNMCCRYCFYEDELKNRSVVSYGMMSMETTEALIRETLVYAEGLCTFGFQGGEPTLRGLEFFKAFVALVEQYNTKHITIQYALQTNGLLIDEAWADFFVAHQVLVGISLDGTKEINDCNRLDSHDKSTFTRVMHTIQLLKRKGVAFNILTVVTSQTARRIEKIYHFFMKQNLPYHQYIPCLDPFGEARGQHPYSLSCEDYGKFLIKLFDLWYADREKGVFVYNRHFENLAGMLQGRPPESCAMGGMCSRQLVVEADGSAYPCDFYMLDGYKLGNFNQNTMEELFAQEEEIGFIRKSQEGHEDCKACEYGWICRGGCRRDRQPAQLDAPLETNYYCQAYRQFFAHALPKIRNLI